MSDDIELIADDDAFRLYEDIGVGNAENIFDMLDGSAERFESDNTDVVESDVGDDLVGVDDEEIEERPLPLILADYIARANVGSDGRFTCDVEHWTDRVLVGFFSSYQSTLAQTEGWVPVEFAQPSQPQHFEATIYIVSRKDVATVLGGRSPP